MLDGCLERSLLGSRQVRDVTLAVEGDEPNLVLVRKRKVDDAKAAPLTLLPARVGPAKFAKTAGSRDYVSGFLALSKSDLEPTVVLVVEVTSEKLREERRLDELHAQRTSYANRVWSSSVIWFIVYSREHLGCFGARGRGTCTNTLTIPRQEVEDRVLRALQEKLMRKDFFEEFCDEFTKEVNRLRMQQGASIASAKRELARIEARKSKLINLVLDDQLPALEAKEELLKNAKRREELEAQLRVADEPPPLLHPRMADVYRRKVEELAEALQRPDARLEASETLRGLIDSIVLSPDGGQLRIELRGNLAAMLTATQQKKRSPDAGDLLMPVQLVAGACNRRYLQLWSGAAWARRTA